MSYLNLFHLVTNHLERLGQPYHFKRGLSLPKEEIDLICQRSTVPIPASLVEMYSEIGDGFCLEWEARGEHSPSAYFEVLPLQQLSETCVYALNRLTRLCSINDFHSTKDPRLASQTAHRMRKWVPFYSEGNGSALCLDAALDPAPVLFNQHAWFDGGSGHNGSVLGNSLLDFMTSWSDVCFQWPACDVWQMVVKREGGVDWESAEFSKPFRLAKRS